MLLGNRSRIAHKLRFAPAPPSARADPAWWEVFQQHTSRRPGMPPNETIKKVEESPFMERVQLHKFIDLSKPTKRPEEPKGMSRRSFLAAVTGTAAITAIAPDAFARNFID